MHLIIHILSFVLFWIKHNHQRFWVKIHISVYFAIPVDDQRGKNYNTSKPTRETLQWSCKRPQKYCTSLEKVKETKRRNRGKWLSASKVLFIPPLESMLCQYLFARSVIDGFLRMFESLEFPLPLLPPRSLLPEPREYRKVPISKRTSERRTKHRLYKKYA